MHQSPARSNKMPEKKKSSVSVFFGSIFGKFRGRKSASCSNVSKASAEAAKAEFDQVKPTTERLSGFKRPAPPRKKRGSRPPRPLTRMTPSRLSEEIAEYEVTSDEGGATTSSVASEAPHDRSVDIPLPANVRNYVKAKKSGAKDSEGTFMQMQLRCNIYWPNRAGRDW